MQRIIEAEDTAPLNHGKFHVALVGDALFSTPSSINRGKSVADALPVVKRFGQVRKDVLIVTDLQTQEGMMMSPSWSIAQVRQRFLCHPIHVCILFFPMLVWLQANPGKIWTADGPLVFDLKDVLNQPGLLVDATGAIVRNFAEWSRRLPVPIAARFRNREQAPDNDVPPEEVAQGDLTEQERAVMLSRPPAAVW